MKEVFTRADKYYVAVNPHYTEITNLVLVYIEYLLYLKDKS